MVRRGFRVKIEDVESIYKWMKNPTPYNEKFDISHPRCLGELILSPPLKKIQLLYESTGEKVSLVVEIFIDAFPRDNKLYYYPITFPIDELRRYFNVVAVRNTILHIYLDEEAEDPRFVVVQKTGAIMISAGFAEIESAPAIPLTSEEQLEKDLKILAQIIEITIHGIYNAYASLQKPLFFEPNITLYLRPPLRSSRDNDNDSEDNGDGNNEGGEETQHKRELKTAIHKINPKDIEETLDDVQGVDEAKAEIMEVVEVLRNPNKFKKMGARVLRGVLLTGPPGTGKTMLAKATAKAADVPFFSASGSEFVEIYVGRGAGRIRELFREARKYAPCIIFFDEFDALARQRGDGSGGASEYNHALSQLLVELDGFERNKGIVVIAATNMVELLDLGIMRPGRFDRVITLDLPDAAGREAILKVHSKNKPLEDNVDLKKIALTTPGFSGAQLASIMNEAALLAIRENAKKISLYHIQEARNRVLMGCEHKLRILEKEQLETAYHEIGHAIVRTLLYPDVDPVEIVTIKPRGNSLGMTMSFKEEDRRSVSKKQLEAELAVYLAGRIAEEIVLGKDNYSTGASSDLRYATECARRMVTEWGMGKKTGLAALGRSLKWRFLGGFSQGQEGCSEKTAQLIDDEVRRILKRSYKKARKILRKNKDKLCRLAKILVEKKTLSGEEVREFLETPLSKKQENTPHNK